MLLDPKYTGPMRMVAPMRYWSSLMLMGTYSPNHRFSKRGVRAVHSRVWSVASVAGNQRVASR